MAPEAAAADLAGIQEPRVVIVDDVAFIHPEQGMAIGRQSRSGASASNTIWRRGVTSYSASKGCLPTGSDWV